MRRCFALLVISLASVLLHADSVPLCVSGAQVGGTSCSTGILTLTFLSSGQMTIDSVNQLSFHMPDRSGLGLQFTVSADNPIYWISSTLSGTFWGGGGSVSSWVSLGGQGLSNTYSLDTAGSFGPQVTFLNFQQAMTGTGNLDVNAEGTVHSYIYCGSHPEIVCSGIAEGDATFEFGLTPTPEPGSLVMFSLGLVLTGTWLFRTGNPRLAHAVGYNLGTMDSISTRLRS